MNYFVVLLLLMSPCAKGELMRMAQCPQEPDVKGVYRNDGKKCVRQKHAMKRERIDAVCPEGSDYYQGLCRRPKDSGRKEPLTPSEKKARCPAGYEWGFYLKNQNKRRACLTKCQDGYQAKYNKCVQPEDKLPNTYMTCPNEGDHRVDAYCSSLNIECLIEAAPGAFRYREDGICERPKTVLGRTYEYLPKGGDSCPNANHELVVTSTVRVCQEPCPEHYLTKKGRCLLPKCLVKANEINNFVVQCPEGLYRQTDGKSLS
eukprot:CAMPEP_0194200238 /NCGR_PEP_ID=MMETSP0156-20130528/932_1 /TAXON_ID=33649 /ORGANISM="Thalassionema nitzschioides, Strain L26-B" /LENGTH=259 /DNA_ID=CAMNT_0038925211 /DNA_START=18 /DNA_END=797 /DNA_ORIENTATION=+